ncbi:MAG TPA: NlpC/P60 family protein [Acidimicrobiales bacterium]|nr:NlpC/P60 family protein [Acidimicrobiales bacterium]
MTTTQCAMLITLVSKNPHNATAESVTGKVATRPLRRTRASRMLAFGAASLSLSLPMVFFSGPQQLANADPSASISSDQALVVQIAATVNTDNQKLNGLDEAYNEAQIRVNQDASQVNSAKASLANSQQQESATVNTLRKEAVAAYIQGGHLAALAALVDGSGTDMAVRGYYVDQASNQAQSTVSVLKEQQHQIARQQDILQQALTVDKQDLSQVQSDLQQQQATLSSENAQLAQVKGNLAAAYHQLQVQQQEAAQQAALAAQQAAQQAAQGGSGANAPIVASGPAPPPNARAGTAVQAALAQQGKPYIWGGAGPDGFDCSGLVMYAWGQAGVSLAHGSITQYYETTRVGLNQLEPGDLVFYSPPGDPWLGHVAMYIGAGEVVEANTQGTNVGVFSMYYVGTPVGYGRVS